MKPLSLLYYIIMCALVAACANPGQGPDGGPYDETPPTVTLLSPQMGERDVKKIKKVTLGFSEAIKVENPSEKIVVSPPQHEQPEIKISGKRITVELVDSLLPLTPSTFPMRSRTLRKAILWVISLIISLRASWSIRWKWRAMCSTRPT